MKNLTSVNQAPKEKTFPTDEDIKTFPPDEDIIVRRTRNPEGSPIEKLQIKRRPRIANKFLKLNDSSGYTIEFRLFNDA